MYAVLFAIGIGLFVMAAILGLRESQSLVAVVFGGLSVASFVLFFMRQPVQALEENLEFTIWLGVALNTYGTQLMYMQDSKTIQADLRVATIDYSNMVERCAEEALHLWRIEEYHRGLKQFCSIERAQHRSAQAQRNHIGLALRAFLRLECHRLRTGVSWFEAKTAIMRETVRAYLAQPLYVQLSTA